MPQFNEPVEESYTEWFNPLTVEQRVDLFEGDSARPTRYRIPPGGTKRIPSRHDSAIHTVHNGVIIGGLAPQLVKKGADEKLDPALDTARQERERAEADAKLAAIARKQAEDDLILARVREQEAARIEAERAKAKADAESEAKAKAKDEAKAKKQQGDTPLPPDLKQGG